jgi:hypothetical protein
MPRVRLLAMSLFACSALTFAQQVPDVPRTNSPGTDLKLEARSGSEPWRIIPRDLVHSGLAQDRIEHPKFGDDQNRIGQKKKFVWQSTPNSDDQTSGAPDGVNPGDTACYAIRSYVVARDNKHSDSTHLVGYSTCQPALRYGLKKVDSAPRQESR